jgi:hypothetical protein
VWGVIGPAIATDHGDGTYSAVYNAGTTERDWPGVTLQAKDDAIATYNTINAAVTNTINLKPHTPAKLVQDVPALGDPVPVDHCLENPGEVKFYVRDACDNLITDDQLSKLSASHTVLWTPISGEPGGMGNFSSISGNKYSVKYITSKDSCGPNETAEINIDHSGFGGAIDLTVPLNLYQCDYPGVNVWFTNTTLTAGCANERAQVNARLLEDQGGDCAPSPADAVITLEVQDEVPVNIVITPYGELSPRNARFLTPTDTVGLATYTETAYAGSTIVADLIAWDAVPGDELHVQATADVLTYGDDTRKAVYGPTEPANHVDIRKYDTSAITIYENSLFETEVDYYDVPLLVDPPGVINAMPGYIYAQIKDCDENRDSGAADTITAYVVSDNAGFTNTLPYTFTETDDVLGGIANNTGVFRAQVPMSRVTQAGVLRVDKGAKITIDYDDPDGDGDTDEKEFNLTGCRELLVVDGGYAVKNSVTPAPVVGNAYTILEGDSSFRLIANAPTSKGIDNDTINTTIIHLPPGVPLTARVCSTYESDADDGMDADETNKVYLIEKRDVFGKDTGMFVINSTLLGGEHDEEFMFVGEDKLVVDDHPVDPDPGGDASLGVLVNESPDTIWISVPATAISNNCIITNTDLLRMLMS